MLCLSGVMILLCAVNGASAFPDDTQLDSAKIRLVHQDYKGAHDVLNRYKAVHPGSFEAMYLSVIVEQTRILDYESYMVDGKQFRHSADSLKRLLEKRIEQLRGDDSILCVFYIANLYGGIGIIQAKTGEWFDAVKNAVASVSLLKQVRKRKPQFRAAYLGIGIFDYYLSTSFKWLPFVDVEGGKGMESIRMALTSEFPYNYGALNSYCWILIEQQKYAKADSIALKVLSDLPDNSIFLRIRTLIAFWTGKYDRSLELGKKLVQNSTSRSPVNWSDMIAGYYVVAGSYDKKGMKNECVKAASTMLSSRIPKGYREIPHIKRNLNYLSDVLEKNRKQLSNKNAS
jgi:tetratricopeptide (TPR) repeat protein